VTDALQPIAAILFVLALLGVVLRVLQRRGLASFRLPGQLAGGERLRQLELLDRLVLDAQHAVHLVRVGEKKVLIATGPGSCQLLDGKALERVEP
jgi:flagellar biogenesis protein FliO